MRVLHLTDRLSARGGADWHLLGVIRAQVRDPGRDGGPAAVTLAVGKMDNTVAPPCPTERAACLSARDERPAEAALRPLVRKVAPDLLHLHNVVNPAVLEWAAGAGLPALATVQDHRAFCPGRGKWTAAGQVCDAPLCRKRCRECHPQRYSGNRDEKFDYPLNYHIGGASVISGNSPEYAAEYETDRHAHQPDRK